MERYETQGTAHSGDVLDTIAFGSMLVFASVMPPLGPDTAEANARPARYRFGPIGEEGVVDPEETRARGSRRRFAS